MKVKTKWGCNVRNAPNLDAASDVGDLAAGEILTVQADAGDFYEVLLYVAKSVIEVIDETPEPPEPGVAEYYVCHDWEYGELWRGGVPEVFHFDMLAPTSLTKAWQQFIMALNPGMDGNGWRSLAKHDRAFTNGPCGYDYPDGPPRADFINGLNLNAKPPINDKCRCCGGAILHGKLNGKTLTVETLDGSKPPPPIEWVLARPWLYFRTQTIKRDGTNGDFPQNGGKPVYWPLVATGSVTVEIDTIVPEKPYPYIKIVKRE